MGSGITLDLFGERQEDWRGYEMADVPRSDKMSVYDSSYPIEMLKKPWKLDSWKPALWHVQSVRR